MARNCWLLGKKVVRCIKQFGGSGLLADKVLEAEKQVSPYLVGPSVAELYRAFLWTVQKAACLLWGWSLLE